MFDYFNELNEIFNRLFSSEPICNLRVCFKKLSKYRLPFRILKCSRKSIRRR